MQLGRYEVLRKLGEGGMARVLLAKNASGDPVVLKVPFTQNADFAERVRDEARVGLRVHHPSVVDTLDLFEHEGRPILVVEYVEGASLQQLRHQGGAMPAGLVARVGRQVADGLAFIHDATDENDKPLNILHRDVAPGNILVTADGNAKLIDLGIARGEETKAKRTQVGTVRGTLRYLAPELLAGEKHTPATDLWALGVVLFEAALGRRAAEGDERDVLATIVRGDIGKLRDGEALDEALRDGIFALLAPREGRLQRAKAAVNVMKRIEESLEVDGAWCARAVGAVLERTRTRWATEGPPADLAALAAAETVARKPVGAKSSAEHDDDARTAATLASPASSSSSASLPTEVRTGITDPRPKVAPDQELGHADGVAPTVRMSAVDVSDALGPGAATEMMPAVDPTRPPSGPSDADTRVRSAPVGFDQTQKFPKPGHATSPATPLAEGAAPEAPGSSLAWRSVAAPTLLGLTATEIAPSTPRPATLHQAPSEPIIAAEPDEKTEAGAPPPSPPRRAPPAGAPAPEPPALGFPATQKSKEFSGPVPRMLRIQEEQAVLQRDTELAQPAVDLASLPSAHATERTPAPAPQRSLDPAHRAPDPRALGIPTPPSSAAAAARTAAKPPVDEATETAFPFGVPDSLTPSAPVLEAPKAPAKKRAPVVENSDRTMRMPPAPRAGYVGQSANPADATERVERWSPKAVHDAAAGFEEPLLSGELDWRPNRTKHIAIAAGIVVALAVATVVVLALT